MGGLVALDALREPLHPAPVAVALSSPLLGVKVEAPPIKLALAGVLSRLLPWLPLANELDTHAISRDPEVVRTYESDPLVFSTITPRWFTEMNRARERVREAAPRGRLPLRMMVGTADRICDHEASLAFAEAWGGPTTVAVYEGHYHELFNEPDKADILAELVAWLDEVAA